MEVIYLDEKVDFSKKRTVIGLGNFDGFHKGHIHLLKEIKNISKKNALISSLLIFRTHTDEIFNKKDYKYLSFLSDKFEILKNFGIDRVFVKSFDVDFSNKTKEEFIKFLTEELGVSCIVVGDDYTFGRNAEGNVEWLGKNKEKYKLETGIVSQLKIGEILVKTSQIKEFLSEGKICFANEFLGRPYTVKGIVVDGNKIGRTMSFPTANIDTSSYFLPKEGVYFTKIEIKGQKYPSLTSIGKNPTFNLGVEKFEVYILDFFSFIYGETVKISFLEFMREIKKFNGKSELIEQIKKDKKNAYKLKCIYKKYFI